MITALRSRIAHLITLLCVALTAFGAATIYAPAAFARVDPNGPYPYPATMATPSAASTAVTTHVSSGSGLATWLVVVIAIALLVAGAALAEGARSVLRRQVPRRAAVAS